MFKLEFETENAAFDESPVSEIVRVLRALADRIDGGDDYAGAGGRGRICDVNGNTIGAWSISEGEG